MFADFGRVEENGKRGDGRGTSFKGWSDYTTNDKPGPDGVYVNTSERVTIIDLGNFAHIQGEDRANLAIGKTAWRHMMHLSDVREAERKAGKIRGQEVKKPVFSYYCSFHATETPTVGEMRDAMRGSLEALGLSEHQYQCYAHNDGGAVHIHVCVNLIHPETLKVADLRDNRAKLKNWAMKWDLGRGFGFSDDLINEAATQSGISREQFIKMIKANDIRGLQKVRNQHQKARKQAAESGMPILAAAKEPRKSRSREEHMAQRTANDNAKDEAKAIKDTFAERWREVKAQNEMELGQDRAEIAAIYAERDAEIRLLRAAYKEGRIRPEPGLLPTSRRLLAAREKKEWKALYRMNWERKRAFELAEREGGGRFWNAIKLAASAHGDLGSETGRLGLFVKLMSDPRARATLFESQLNRSKATLRAAQDARWAKITRTPTKAVLDAAIMQVREETALRVEEARGNHKIKSAIRQGRWQALSQSRGAAWAGYAEKYAMAPSAVVAMGTAPYAHNPSNRPSFYITLDNGKTYWGHGLKEAAEFSDLQIGELVKITSRLDKTKPFERVNRATGEKTVYFKRVFSIDRPQAGVLVSNLTPHSKRQMEQKAERVKKEFTRRADKPAAPSYAELVGLRPSAFKKPETPVRLDFGAATGMDQRTILKTTDARKARQERKTGAFRRAGHDATAFLGKEQQGGQKGRGVTSRRPGPARRQPPPDTDKK